MKDYLLFIDTNDIKNLRIALIGAKPRFLTHKLNANPSEKIVSALQAILPREKVLKIGKVVVNTGPGSFSGVRTGVAIGQALGYALDIPVFGIKACDLPEELGMLRQGKGLFRPVRPLYHQAPHITFPKVKKIRLPKAKKRA